MSLDSLFLARVSQAPPSKLGLKIKFRQLMGQLSDLSALADHVEQNTSDAPEPLQLAPSPEKPPPTMVQTAQPPAELAPFAPSVEGQARCSTVNGAAIVAGEIEDFCERQLQTLSELIGKQRKVLRDAGRDAIRPMSASTAKTESARPALALQPAVQMEPETASGATELHASPQFRPLIQIGDSVDLIRSHQRHLDAHPERYNRYIAGSKQMTQNHRATLGDPAVGAGVDPKWKELFDPIVTVRSRASNLWEVDGNQHIALVNGYAIMLGHVLDLVTAAVKDQLQINYETGPQLPIAGKVADAICEMMDMDRAAFCNTSTGKFLGAGLPIRALSELELERFSAVDNNAAIYEPHYQYRA